MGWRATKVSHTFTMCFVHVLINLLGFHPSFSIQNSIFKDGYFVSTLLLHLFIYFSSKFKNRSYNTMEEGHWNFSLHHSRFEFVYCQWTFLKKNALLSFVPWQWHGSSSHFDPFSHGLWFRIHVGEVFQGDLGVP